MIILVPLLRVRASTRVGDGPWGAAVAQTPRRDAPAAVAAFSQAKAGNG